MKKRISAAVLCLMFAFSSMPLYAAPRDRDQDFPRIVKRLLKLFGVVTTGDGLLPPRPAPAPPTEP